MTPSDQVEFTTFVRDHGPGLHAYTRLLTSDAHSGEDLLQQALLKVLQKWPRASRAPVAYTRTVILNLVRDRVRSPEAKVDPVATLPDASIVQDDVSSEQLETGDLLPLLANLPERQRITVVLRVIEGMSEADTATALRCAKGTVKSNLARGLANVRQQLAATSECEMYS